MKTPELLAPAGSLAMPETTLAFGSTAIYADQRPIARMTDMPTISIFYGIVIAMYFKDIQRHHLPHIHARYQNANAVFSIEDGSLLDGEFPPNKTRLVQAWIEIHREDLQADWSLAIKGEEPLRISPLQ